MTPYGQLRQARGAKEDTRALSARGSITKGSDPSGPIAKVLPHSGFGPIIRERDHDTN